VGRCFTTGTFVQVVTTGFFASTRDIEIVADVLGGGG
jgi:pyridoxal/pyridoxine/pyridoxamine kinase